MYKQLIWEKRMTTNFEIMRAFFSKEHASDFGAIIARQPNGNYLFVTHWWYKKNIPFKSILSIKESLNPDLKYVGDVESEIVMETKDLITAPGMQVYLKQVYSFSSLNKKTKKNKLKK